MNLKQTALEKYISHFENTVNLILKSFVSYSLTKQSLKYSACEIFTACNSFQPKTRMNLVHSESTAAGAIVSYVSLRLPHKDYSSFRAFS